jgi:hypothetical protein
MRDKGRMLHALIDQLSDDDAAETLALLRGHQRLRGRLGAVVV